MVMIHRHQVYPEDAQRRWGEITSALFGSFDVDLGDTSRFRGAISYARLGAVEISRVASTREFARRTKRQVAEKDREKLILVNVRRGSVSLNQGGRVCDVQANSFVLYDANRPVEWTHADHAVVRNVAIPGSLLRGRLRSVDRAMYRVYPSSTGLWRLASDFFGSVEDQLDSIPEEAAHDLAGQLIALISLALEADDAGISLDTAELRAAIHRRCAAVIRTHIADPGLTPAKIAAMAGVSVRTLHRAFQEAGESLGDHLLNARLDICRAALDDPGKTHLSIGEIAYRAGFRSQAHFANTFKRRFGCTASDWRDRALRARD